MRTWGKDDVTVLIEAHHRYKVQPRRSILSDVKHATSTMSALQFLQCLIV